MSTSTPVPFAVTCFIRGHIVANSHPINMTIGAYAGTALTPVNCQALTDSLATWIVGQNSRFNADHYWDIVEAVAQDTSGVSATSPIGTQGTLAGDAVDYAQCKVIVNNTGNRRAGIGRLYFPGQVTTEYSSTDKSEWVAAVNTSGIAFLNQMISHINTVAPWVASVVSHSRGIAYPMSPTGSYARNLKINHVTGRDAV